MGGDYYNGLTVQGGACGTGPITDYKPPTIKQRLEAAEKSTLDRAKSIQEAKAILEKYPDIEKLLDILQKNAF